MPRARGTPAEPELPAWGTQQFSAVVEAFPAHDWRVVRVPDPPRATHPWGRTPVTATLTTAAGPTSWPTSTWRHRGFGTILMLPRELHAAVGGTVEITLQPRSLDDAPPPRPRRVRRD